MKVTGVQLGGAVPFMLCTPGGGGALGAKGLNVAQEGSCAS